MGITLLLLNGLFIGKLIKVHRSCSSVHSEQKMNSKLLLNIITKISILCFSSTCCTFLFAVMYFLENGFHWLIFYFMTPLCLICDLYTNFLSVLLSFSYFNVWYMQ